MAYVRINSSRSARSRLEYLFDEAAHDGSRDRVLDTVGGHIRLWGQPDQPPYAHQSGYYLNTQFEQLRAKTYNPGKRIQAKHLIISFAKSEFSNDNSNDLKQNAHKINQLVQSFMDKHFPDAQYVSAVQCDGKGHKLHAHVMINSIAINGKCVQTNRFGINQLRDGFNSCLETNYHKVVHKTYVNPFEQQRKPAKAQPKGWNAQLQLILDQARKQAETFDEYVKIAGSKGVKVKKRNKKGDLSYQMVVNGKTKTVRDFYQRINKRNGQVKSTRGLGVDYTPNELKQYFAAKHNHVAKPQNEFQNALMAAVDSHLSNNKRFAKGYDNGISR